MVYGKVLRGKVTVCVKGEYWLISEYIATRLRLAS
ncbi:hypothetical protein PAECIP111802_04978 [Paenibacillus allorhizosphaerae]|uniref:DNA-binding protein n=1 Tax=Paenibacillus allorhizosphaerae TaxID=2849866 RepID=A0ABM8VNH6_9BACL|nr:hypothetical protein PAECIP111802_04978 [Paenibacillus allorhizosphaerae]